MLNLIDNAENEVEKWFEILKHTKKPIGIFTTGSVGKGCYEALINVGINVSGFIDNSTSKIGSEILNTKVYELKHFMKEFPDAFMLLASRQYRLEILEQLRCQNYKTDNIITVDFSYYNMGTAWNEDIDIQRREIEVVEEIWNDRKSKETFVGKLNFLKTFNEEYLRVIRSTDIMYFDKEIIGNMIFKDVIIDGGGYIGDTYKEFIKVTDNYKKYLLCEPDEKNFFQARKNTSKDKRVECIKKALWSGNTVLKFNNLSSGSSRIDEMVGVQIETTSIDNLAAVIGEKISFIKLDVEGAEKEALLGAKDVIKRDKPVLAVCVYHKLLDIIELPQLIKALNPEYKLFLRHYSCGGVDTVCYAI